MTDLLIILAGAIVLLALGTSWVWHNLVRQFKELLHLESELKEVLSHRQDTIPYLIESYQNAVTQPNPHITEIISQRAIVRESKSFDERFKQEKVLNEMLDKFFEKTMQNQLLQRDIGWLEARTEIQGIAENVVTHQKRYQDLRIYISDKLEQFPYMIFKTALEKKL